jgi:DNA adenine methylase
MQKVTRPALRYHGGKFKLAPWIVSHFPEHRIYVEPYGGAASVLLRKQRSYAEVYNDLDGEIVNLFRVLRNPAQARELIRLIKLTPFAREEFENSYLTDGDPIEQARRTIVRSFMGFGSGGATGKNTGFRNNATRSGTTPTHDWMNYPPTIAAIAQRMIGVTVENRPAAQVMQTFDSLNTLHYVDPPYVFATRIIQEKTSGYRHEMTDDQHVELAAVLKSLKGMVILSGYQCPLYDELYADWQRVDKASHADGALDRTESMWIKANTVTMPSLFDFVASS